MCNRLFLKEDNDNGNDSRSGDHGHDRYRNERPTDRWIAQGATHTLLMKGIPDFAEEKDVSYLQCLPLVYGCDHCSFVLRTQFFRYAKT